MNEIHASLDALFQGENLTFLGVVSLDVQEDFLAYRRWLEDGKHAEMHFLENHQELRADPSTLLPGAKSAVLFGLRYDQGDERQTEEPRVAQYARFADYHRVLREKGERIVEACGWENARVLVDSAPLLERALAAKSERGFIGKNTCYIHPTKGSLILLGEILTTAELEFDKKVPVDPTVHDRHGGCGACKECQVHCPTGALNEAYQIDSSLCLAYWTIENRGPIPEKFWPWLGEYYFGCDICQLVCPYNLKVRDYSLPREIKVRTYPPLFEIATMDQKQYENYFGGTPMTRAKRNGLRRNALIAMRVKNDPKLEEALALAEQDAESPIAETIRQVRAYESLLPSVSSLA